MISHSWLLFLKKANSENDEVCTQLSLHPIPQVMLLIINISHFYDY